MPLVRVPVRIEFPNAGGPGFNVLHVRTFDPDQGSDLSEALNALEAFYTALKALYTVGTKVIIGEGMISDPNGSPTYVDDDSRTVNGTGTQTGVPNMVALVASWRTSSATRSGRGRTFLGPISGGSLETNGTPATTTLATARAAALALVNDSQTANGWALTVLSTKQGIARDVTGVTIRDRWAVLTSRRD